MPKSSYSCLAKSLLPSSVVAAALLLMSLAAPARAQQARPVRKGKAVAVTIRSMPDGAVLYLDDKIYGPVAYTPWKGKLVKGQYTVILELPGFKPARVALEVSKANQEIAIPLEAEARPGVLEILASGGDEGATGAPVQIDGQPMGAIPLKVSLPAGRHGIVIRRDGYAPFGEWVELKSGETRSMSITLKKLAAATAKGALLVTADVADADVLVDGSNRGKAPMVVADLDAGPHLVEVRGGAAGGIWSQTVTVAAGATTKVAAVLVKAPQTGTLRVISNVSPADVLVDGEVRGTAPLTVPDLSPGKHYVEVRSEGFAPGELEVEVVAGQQVVVKVPLEKAAPTPSPTPTPTPTPNPLGTGRLVVTVASAPRAEVFLDSAPIGPEPIDREVPVGRHLVQVRTAGFQDFAQVVDIVAGQPTYLAPNLLKVMDPGGGGTVDDPLPTPAPVIKKPLTPAEQAAMVEERRLTSFGARVIRPGKFTADLSAGYPHPFEGRLSVGALFEKSLGLDLSVEARILYLQEYELGLSGRLRLLDRMPFAAAAFAQIGGGDGRVGRNTFYTNFGAIASLTFQDKVTVSARAYVNLYSDRLCPAADEIDLEAEADGCHLVGDTPANQAKLDDLKKAVGDADFRTRDGGARFMMSAILEIAYSQTKSAFLIFEGPPFQDQRAKFKDGFNSIMLEDDPLTYLRVGMTLKF